MNQDKAKILCVDDEPNITQALRRELRGLCDVTTATSADEGMNRVRNDGPFAVVIADYNMPGMNGVEFLRLVHTVSPESVAVMLTGEAKLEVAVAALHEGRTYRFLTKPWQSDQLQATVCECLEHYQKAVKRRKFDNAYDAAQQEIIRAARIDGLMGICNRRTFDDFHADLHKRSVASGGCYALLMADVDNFKKYNDTYGHAEGDEALKNVATAMKNALRGTDFIARYGGEEIVVLCEGVSIQEVDKVAERLRAGVYAMNMPHLHNEAHGRVTISIGVAIHEAGQDADASNVLVRADKAMYLAKRSKGRNAFVIDASAQSPPPAEPSEVEAIVILERPVPAH